MPMTKELTLSGKVALITGASSGIGYEIAKTFAESGSKVVINGRNQKNLERLSQVISDQGGKVVSVEG